ncbi:MAG: hypothetical protein HY819_18630 [Acidobacteria bacterium]|nr:hypothetical protein [Acidobacteriota bacterium]
MAISSTSSTNNISQLDNNLNNNPVTNAQKATTASKTLAGLSVSVAQPPQESPINTQNPSLKAQDNISINSVASANALVKSSARTASVPDTAFDGKYVGANGQTSNNVSDIQPVKPNNGIAQTGKTVFYVNGIQTDLAAQQKSLQVIANQTGANVIGIHNATEGFTKDVSQSALDKADLGKNPPVDTLADAIYNAAKTGKPINVIAHSQGGIITSRAVEDATNRLREDGLSSQAARDLLSKSVNIQTFGGAALTYPAGPNYRHVVNTADPVPGILGKGAIADKNTEKFTDNRAGLNPLKVFDNHSFDSVYASRIKANLFR